ncbi:Gfo/Idh/MocA family protein [Nocardia sp. NPDC004573]|uniref:Gfo/Idh/MocA family protein n=1 Tax=Nocardia sp. NPDC047038 TaxID=3154338 RepID=UPI003411B673
MERLRIAVIGCGVAAQTRHLPALARLGDRFRVVALCDTDTRALEQAAMWATGCRTFVSLGELFAAAELFDAVLIATSGEHVPEIQAAAAAGKPTFVEKPLSLTPEQARPLVEALESAGVSCVVGYMKRYSDAVTTALGQVGIGSGLRTAAADLVHPPEDRYLYSVLGRARPPGGSLSDFVNRQVTDGASAAAIRRTVGVDAPLAALAAYFLLATSVIHDVNLLRTALGGHARVVNAALWNDGLSGQATLRSPSGRVGLLSYTFVSAGRYTETLSLVGDTARCAVSFPSPYLPYAPIALDTESGGDAVTRELFYDDVFAAELIAFHDQTVSGRASATGPREALADLELIAEIARSAQTVERDTTTEGNRRVGLC